MSDLLRILVIEDNLSNMILTVTILENFGYEVLQAENAEIGIKLAQEEHPDFIFMDIQLPGMDGLEATKQLKADPDTNNIIIYALTAFAMEDDQERIMAAGCDGFLAKPLTHAHFLALVDAVEALHKK